MISSDDGFYRGKFRACATGKKRYKMMTQPVA